jgi:hypothetical protein
MGGEATTHAEDGRTYVSCEPCHWGMIEMPPDAATVLNWLEGLRAYKRFAPYPWPEAMRMNEEA